MNLSREGRGWYKQEIDTTPAVSAWEASFDGENWVAGEFVDGVWRWLVNGPDFDADAHPDADSSTVPQDGFKPRLRFTDNPEVDIVRGAPINLYG